MSRGQRAAIELLDDAHVTLIPSGERLTLHRGERVVVTQALGGHLTVHTESGHLARINGADAVALGLGDLIDSDARPQTRQRVNSASDAISESVTPVTVARRAASAAGVGGVAGVGGAAGVDGVAGVAHATTPGSSAASITIEPPGADTPVGAADRGDEFDMAQVMGQLKTVFDPEIPVNIVDLGLIYSCEATQQTDGRYRVDIEMSMTAPGCGMGDVLKIDARDRVAALAGVGQVNVVVVWDPPWDMDRMSDAARLQLGML